MRVELDDILGRIALRPGHDQEKTLIQDLVGGGVPENARSQRPFPRQRPAPREKTGSDGESVGPRETHDPDAPHAGRGGDRADRGIGRVHGNIITADGRRSNAKHAAGKARFIRLRRDLVAVFAAGADSKGSVRPVPKKTKDL